MATLDELTERIRRAVAEDESGLDVSVKLDLKGEGFIHLDGTEVTNADRPADLVVSVSRADLAALGRGELDPARALFSGRLRLSDVGLALRLQPRIQALFAKAV